MRKGCYRDNEGKNENNYQNVVDCWMSKDDWLQPRLCQLKFRIWEITESLIKSLAVIEKKPPEQVLNKLWTCYEQRMNKSWKSHEQVMNKSWISYEQVMNKLWTTHEQVMYNSWTSH